MRRHLKTALRTLLTGLLASQALLVGAQPAQLPYPSRPIKILVGVPPGGSTDTVARMFAEWLRESWGQPTVVENKPGANTAVAADAVTRSAPDGYTMLLATNAHITIPLLTKLTYDPIKDFIPVGTVGVSRYVMSVNPLVPANTLQEFIAYAKTRPGQLNYGSSGNGGGSHINGEMFNRLAGVQIQHIPYKGAGPALTDTIGGQVQVSYNTPMAVAAHINAGKLKPLAVTGPKRMPQLPQVPTFAEAGLPAFQETVWYGVFLPAGTPKPIVDKLNAEIARMLSASSVKEKLEKQGTEPLLSTPEQFTAMLRTETGELAKLIKSAHIKID